MSADRITHADNGEERVPLSDDDWQAWVAATKTRNWIEKDPLLNWLDLYGAEKGFPAMRT